MNSFQTIWQSINNYYFDPDFGGLDWNDVYRRYGPCVSGIEDGPVFYEMANKMLFELNASNTLIVPPNDMTFFSPVVLSEGSTGVDIRLIDNRATITRIEPGSPAEEAGLMLGFQILSVNRTEIHDIVMAKEPTLKPPFSDRSRRYSQTHEVLNRLYGQAGSVVTIGYLDQNRQRHELELTRRPRVHDLITQLGDFPAFLSFEAKRLDSDVGYVRFNCFHPDIADAIIYAIDSMADTSGLIIDLRGNSCGLLKTRKALADKLVNQPALFWQFRTRHECYDVFLDPAEDTYDRPVAILIDGMSGEASEEFAGCMQAIGRAAIIGERTRGAVLATQMIQLPRGANFIFAVAQILTANGTVLEGRGVLPDIEVPLDQHNLLGGTDRQVEAALDHLGTCNSLSVPSSCPRGHLLN